MSNSNKGPRSGKGAAGLIFVIVGLVLLANQLDLVLPAYAFSWQMLLVLIGLFVGLRSNFRNPIASVLILVGGILLLNDYTGLNLHIAGIPLVKLLPGIVLVMVGLTALFGTERVFGWAKFKNGSRGRKSLRRG